MSIFKRRETFFFDMSIVIIALTLHTCLDYLVRDFFIPFWKTFFGENNLTVQIFGIDFSFYSIIASFTVLGLLILLIHIINKKSKILDKKQTKKVKEIEIPYKEIEKIIDYKLNNNDNNERKPGPSKQNGNQLDNLMNQRMFQPIIPQHFYY